MFRINLFKPSREEKYVPNKVRASVRTNQITVSQPHVITKKDVNSDSNGLSSTGVDNTGKTRRPQPRSNRKNDRVPYVFKSSCSKNKEVEVEEHPMNLLLSKNKKHMSSECHNVKLSIQIDKSKVVCAMLFHQDQPSQITYMQKSPPNDNYNPQPTFNQNYMQQLIINPEDISNPITAINMALVLIAKAFKLNYSTPTNNKQIISSKLRNKQIAQPGMNMGQDRQMQMIGGNCGNQFRQYAGQNIVNQNGYNASQNVRNQVVQNAVQNSGFQNHRLTIMVMGTTKIRYGVTTVKEWVIFLGTVESDQGEGMLLVFRLRDIDEIQEVNANCILMANLQQASTSGTQTDKAPVYDLDGSAEVHHDTNCYDNDILNMFTQKEQYTELLDPITEPHMTQQNNNNVISVKSSMEHNGGTVEQHTAIVKETRAYFESLYKNLAIEVEKVNSVNRKIKETNAELTTHLARYKNQQKCFEINQEKYEKLERCYQKSVYQEKCLTKKINALHLSYNKTTTNLNEDIANLNDQLSKEKSTVSYLQQEKKKLKFDFKTCEEDLLDKQIQLENKIKELDNILVKMDQLIQKMHMLSPKPDSFYHTEQKMALGYQNSLYLKQSQ
uniref:Integrase, catalytic region, zinc finger, CCHC-type, peptidase aspartic, catalytic n=1 Tax=Tanacetum cinerariifolium TaxID=118510 RepID=A0A6L2KID3_TANCI|nr:hypothetical protein [Tanacetum cinerariifolium]